MVGFCTLVSHSFAAAGPEASFQCTCIISERAAGLEVGSITFSSEFRLRRAQRQVFSALTYIISEL